MHKQTEEYYKTQTLGFGSGSIYNVGCYLVSLCNGLVKFGHEFTPRTLNELLKSKNLFIGEFKNYINVDKLVSVLPDIFTSFKKIEPWNDMASLQWYLSRNYVVLGKVDARGIGGTGTHFVLITDTVGEDAIIFDPWTGEHQPVKNRYNKYGNIKGLRIFGIVPKLPITENPMPNELQTVLDHYKVKTSDELITMIDAQLGFLESERKKNNELGDKLGTCQTDYKEEVRISNDRKRAIQDLSDILHVEANIESVKSAVNKFTEIETGLNKQIKDLERQVTKRDNEIIAQKIKHEENLDRLQEKIVQMEKKHASELDRLKEQVNNVQQQVGDTNEKEAENNVFKRLLDKIKLFIMKY